MPKPRLFAHWDRPRVVGAIDHLEGLVAAGASIASFNGGGFANFSSMADVENVLAHLQNRLAEIDGRPMPFPALATGGKRPSILQVLPKRDW